MRVFILEEIVDFQEEVFVGVYSTRENALAKIQYLIDERFKNLDIPLDRLYYLQEDMREHYMITLFDIDKGYVAEEGSV